MTGNLKENLSFLKYAREFEREYMRTNYNRIVPVTIILYIFEWIIFFKNNLFLNTGCVILVFQTYNTFLVPLIFYAHKHFESLSICKLKIINYLYLIGIIAFGAFLVYTTRDQLDLLHIFLMMVLSIGALIYIHPKESLLIIVLPAILFISGLYIFQYNADILCMYATNTLIFTVVIYILSASLFVQKVKDLHMLKELKKEIEKLEKL